MADIFLSYAREDQMRVGPLVRALESEGWTVFWDRRIPAGQTWRSHIGKALDAARCVVVAWSCDSVESDWVIEEADVAKRRGVLVPILLDHVEPPMGLRAIQAADLTGWDADPAGPSFRQLLEDIRAVLSTAPPIAPPPLRIGDDVTPGVVSTTGEHPPPEEPGGGTERPRTGTPPAGSRGQPATPYPRYALYLVGLAMVLTGSYFGYQHYGEAEKGVETEPPVAAPAGSPLADMPASDVIGADVISADGAILAEIIDLVKKIGDDQLMAVLGVGGFLGIGEKKLVVSIDELDVDRGGQIILRSAASLEELPVYVDEMYEPAARLP